jgi:hypothetical protein
MPAQPPFFTPTRTPGERLVGLRHDRLDALRPPASVSRNQLGSGP